MPARTYPELLESRGFRAFLWTQFLGALNDNAYKMVLSLLAVAYVPSQAGRYLALAGATFIAPFLLFSGYAGYLADACNKRRVLIATKAMEMGTMLLAFAAFFTSSIELMLAVLFLVAVQATLFSPAKYGILPEMLPEEALSRANGLLEMSTFAAIVLGTTAAGLLFQVWKTTPARIGLVFVAIAAIGSLTSLGISRVPDSGATVRFSANPLAEVAAGFRRLKQDRPLLLTVIGISWFWFLGALLQMDLILLGREALRIGEMQTALMAAALAVGIGAGSLAAGWLSGDRVELGIVPLGSAGMGVCSMLLAFAAPSYGRALAALALLGFTGGLFIVPLNALLQQRSPRHEKGRLIAANNFANTLGILAASATLWLLHERAHVSAAHLILIFGIVTLAATAWIVRLLPFALLRFFLWALTQSLYRIRVLGAANVPAEGPALLVSNHMSYADAVLVAFALERPARFLVHRSFYDSKALGWFFRLMDAIPIAGGADVRTAISRARKALADGELVVIFAEGQISRTGNLLPFKRGMEVIARGLDIPIVPVHLDGVWGSIFSHSGGRVFWKLPRRIPYPVTVSFGTPLAANASAVEVRQAVSELAVAAARTSGTRRDTLERRFVRTARRLRPRLAILDSAGAELSYGRALTGARLLAKRVRRLAAGQEMVGILLPASAAGAIANVAVEMAGKAAINLNFTAGGEHIASVIEQCGLRTILTSRRFLTRVRLQAPQGTVYMEDLASSPSRLEKAWTALQTLLPAAVLERMWCDTRRAPDSVAAIVFTSGSTGQPKGVMLSHRNILANIDSVAQIFHFEPRDRMAGVLPLFHSFGLMGTLWFPLTEGTAVMYHPNPTEADSVGELVAKNGATVLMASPTFAGLYLRKCDAGQFASLRYVFVGSEKLREPLALAFAEKFHVPLIEGYGATEMAPIIAANSPNFTLNGTIQIGCKPETVGLPVPNVAVRIVDAETGERLGPNRQGLVLVNGPNRMLGYYNAPEKTAAVLRDGWYVTGDLGLVDEDGFLQITDRLSRFSKLGGEMVPHGVVEEHIEKIVGDFAVVVTGVADAQKGERLIALYTRPDLSAGELWQRLSANGLPKLWIPKREDIIYVESLPRLGTGKLDLARVKSLAAGLAAREER
jgi:acyl-[acyl-carrier-protein]-phospholipid O-acyltransferase/long-chain-fatty-acid--[acyl-carrier-protein] ligase